MNLKKKLKAAKKLIKNLSEENDQLHAERREMKADIRVLIEDKDHEKVPGIAWKWVRRFEEEDSFQNHFQLMPRTEKFTDGLIIHTNGDMSFEVKEPSPSDSIDWEQQGERMPHESIFEIKNHR